MTRKFIDMTGREVMVTHPPKRIVSLVPSQTELLYDLGLRDEVVGITKFCIHPEEWFRNKKRVGGTKTVHLDQVAALQPDLILANKEENTREQIEELATLFPVWISDIKTVPDALQMIKEVGKLTGRGTEAINLSTDIGRRFAQIKNSNPARRVAYFIWRKPWMCAGGDTFISDIITRMGWENVLAAKNRYPEITLEELTKYNIDLVLLSSEPYPFREAHIAEIQAILPASQINLVDGEMFSWYGSRMREATTYLMELKNKFGINT